MMLHPRMLVRISLCMPDTSAIHCYFYTVAEKWRVVLKGESTDYIHASFANVRKSLLNTKSLRHTVILLPKLSHRLVSSF